MSDERAGQSQIQAALTGPEAVLDQLHALLEEQLELAQQGRLVEAETLCEQTDRLVATVAAAGLLAGPDGEDRRQRLLVLYRQICLTLAAQRDEVSHSLRAIHRGRRLRKTYARHAS
jgi:hypothetical protein